MQAKLTAEGPIATVDSLQEEMFYAIDKDTNLCITT